MRTGILAIAVVVLGACGGGTGTSGLQDVGGLPPQDFVPIPGEIGGDPAGGGGSSGHPLQGGVLAIFQQGNERFAVWVTNTEAADALFDIANNHAPFNVIAGPIRTGAGKGDHNAPWSWHLDPAAISVNKPTSQHVRYSGSPSQVEANVATLVAGGKHKVTGSGDALLVLFADFRGDVPTAGEIPVPR